MGGRGAHFIAPTGGIIVIAVFRLLLYLKITLMKSLDLTPQGLLSHGRGGGHTLFPSTGRIIVMAVSRSLLYLNIALIKSLDLTPQGPLSHGRGGTLYCPQQEALLLWQFLICYCISNSPNKIIGFDPTRALEPWRGVGTLYFPQMEAVL